MSLSDISSLDELFSIATADLRAKRAAEDVELRKPRRIKPKDTPPPPDQLFLDPKNWTLARHVALLHKETQTVLGTFSELVHNTVEGARRLVRVDSPAKVEGTEEVSGDWWLGKHREIASPQSWHSTQTIVMDLRLAKLGVYSMLVELDIRLTQGAIARVELAAQTQFVGPDEELLWLPEGTNVLEVMDQDAKIALRVEMEAQK